MAGIHDQPAEKRQKRAKRVILLVIGLMLVAGLVYNYCWPSYRHFTISPETTYITGPLNDDGTINYVAALNQRMSKGVTPENNAAPLLIRAWGAAIIDEPVRARVFEILQMEPVSEEGLGGSGLEDVVEEMWPKGTPKGATTRPSPEDVEEHSQRVLKRAMAGPWSADELPAVAAWLKANEEPISLAMEATKRTRYYLPLVSCCSPPKLIDAVLRPRLTYDWLDEAISARVMLRAHGGATDAAIADMLAMHRLARLLGQPPLVIDKLIAFAVERRAARCVIAVAASGKLTPAQAKRLLAGLQALPPIPDVAEAIDQGERFMNLDCVMVLYRWREGDGLDEDGFAPQWCYRMIADLDPMLRELNRWHDRMVDVQRRRNPIQRARAAEVLKNDVVQFKVHAFDNGGNKIFAGKLLGRAGRGLLSDGLSDVVVCLLLPVVTVSADERDEAVMHLEVAKIAVALAAFKAEKGEYPQKLSELSPTYVKTVPADIFAEGPLVYKRDGKGYLLYSVGPNMKDDGGLEDEDTDKDDITVRVK